MIAVNKLNDHYLELYVFALDSRQVLAWPLQKHRASERKMDENCLVEHQQQQQFQITPTNLVKNQGSTQVGDDRIASNIVPCEWHYLDEQYDQVQELSRLCVSAVYSL